MLIIARLADTVVNNFVVGLTKLLGFANLAAARRFFNAKLDAHLLSVP